MKRCFACTETKSLTVEHIIPQAIGGKLKARLYCKVCNETFGDTLDNEISKQFGWVGTLLNVKRERSKAQSYEVKDIRSGTTLLFDGKNLKRKDPVVNLVFKDGKNLDFVDITAGSEKELNKICSSVKKRYNIQSSIEPFKEQKQGPTSTEHTIIIDNALLRRAVSKIAYGLACIKLPESIVFSPVFDAIRQYIKASNKPSLASSNYIDTAFMTDYVRPIHKIHIAMNRNLELLVGYVSLFGIYRFTVLLAEGLKSDLEWPGLDYTFDPVCGKQIFGNDNFQAPKLTKENIIHPRQSKEFVKTELDKGYKIIENYVDNLQFRGGEFQ